MTSGVSFKNVNNEQYIQQQNAIAPKTATQNYATAPVKQEQQEDSFASTLKSNAGFIGIFQGIPLVRYLINTKKLTGSYKTANVLTEQVRAISNANTKGLFKMGEGNFFKKAINYVAQAEKTNDALTAVKSAVNAEAKAAKLTAKAQEMAKTGVKSARKIARAESKAAKAVTKLADKLGDADKMVQNINKTGKMAAQAGTKLSKVSKFKNFMKSSGMGIQLVMSGISELLMEVVPTFKELGPEKGLKQLGKSAVRVLGDVVGYAGFQAVGAAVGSVLFGAIPVVGPFLGAALGFGFGMVGSYLAGKITDKITGPSERKIAEQEQQQIASENNPFENFEENALKTATAA